MGLQPGLTPPRGTPRSAFWDGQGFKARSGATSSTSASLPEVTRQSNGRVRQRKGKRGHRLRRAFNVKIFDPAGFECGNKGWGTVGKGPGSCVDLPFLAGKGSSKNGNSAFVGTR